MIRFCPNCDEEREVRIESRRQTLPVRGEQIKLDAEIVVCSVCGEDIFDPHYDGLTLKRAYDLYRERHGLLTSEDIRALRKRYGLSQRSLARLLGWGLVTIQRYEQGKIQDEAHDTVLRSLMDPKSFLDQLERMGDRLPKKIFERAREMALDVSHSISPQVISDTIERVIKLTFEKNPLLCGLRSFDVERLGELVSWIALRCTDLFQTKLAKLLWLIDFGYFRLHRVSITGLSYCRMPHGPAPDRFQLLLGVLEEMGVIRLSERTAGRYTGEVIEATDGTTALDSFSESERRFIEVVVRDFGYRSSRELSELSHRERSWLNRLDGALIPYQEADEIQMLRNFA